MSAAARREALRLLVLSAIPRTLRGTRRVVFVLAAVAVVAVAGVGMYALAYLMVSTATGGGPRG
ncbi:hypothetical protein [Actinophytocola sediminis]